MHLCSRRPLERGAAALAIVLLALATACGSPPRPPPARTAADRAAESAGGMFPAELMTFVQDLAWSPDSTQLAFSLRRISRATWADDHAAAVANSHYDVYLIGADGRDLRPLTHDEGDDQWLSWFPDGKQLAFAGTREGQTAIYAVKTGAGDDATPRLITPPTASTADTAWAPDGRRVVYSSKVDAHAQLYVATLIGTDVHQLSHDSFDHRSPAWSPDGRMLVFQGNPRGQGREDIFVMDAESGAVTRVTDDDANDFYPGWLPDGRVTFTTVDDGGLKHIVAVGRDPTKRETLVDGAFFARVSPDGANIAYLAGEFPDSALYVRPIDATATPLKLVE